MRRLMVVLAAVVLAGGLAGCESPDVALGSGDGGGVAQPPSDEPFLTGTVVSSAATQPVTTECVSESDLDPDGTASSDDPPVCNPNPDTFGTIHVRGDNPGGETEIVATVSKDTPIARRTSGGGFEAATFADLAEGKTVTLWVTGPVMESFPVQGGASYVLLED